MSSEKRDATSPADSPSRRRLLGGGTSAAETISTPRTTTIRPKETARYNKYLIPATTAGDGQQGGNNAGAQKPSTTSASLAASPTTPMPARNISFSNFFSGGDNDVRAHHGGTSTSRAATPQPDRSVSPSRAHHQHTASSTAASGGGGAATRAMGVVKTTVVDVVSTGGVVRSDTQQQAPPSAIISKVGTALTQVQATASRREQSTVMKDYVRTQKLQQKGSAPTPQTPPPACGQQQQANSQLGASAAHSGGGGGPQIVVTSAPSLSASVNATNRSFGVLSPPPPLSAVSSDTTATTTASSSAAAHVHVSKKAFAPTSADAYRHCPKPNLQATASQHHQSFGHNVSVVVSSSGGSFLGGSALGLNSGYGATASVEMTDRHSVTPSKRREQHYRRVLASHVVETSSGPVDPRRVPHSPLYGDVAATFPATVSVPVSPTTTIGGGTSNFSFARQISFGNFFPSPGRGNARYPSPALSSTAGGGGGMSPSSQQLGAKYPAGSEEARKQKQTEKMRKFAEKVATETTLASGPRFTAGHGGASIVALPNVSKSQLSAVVGPAGAVRHKGTDFFSDNLPPPRLVAHARMPIAPRGAIYRSRSADALDEAAATADDQHHQQQRYESPAPVLRRGESVTMGVLNRAARGGMGGAAETLFGPLVAQAGGARDGTISLSGSVSIPYVKETLRSAGGGGGSIGDIVTVLPTQLQDLKPPKTLTPATSALKIPHDGTTAEIDEEEDGEDTEEDLLEEEDDDDEYEVVSFVDAVTDMLPFVVPGTMNYGLTLLLGVIPLSFVGRMHGPQAFNAASVGYFFMCLVAWYPIQGMMFALDALCSHEFGRDPTSDGMGLLLQRGLLIAWICLAAILLPLYPLLGHVLHVFYEPATAAAATDFLMFCPVYLFAMATFTAFMKFLSNQMLPALPAIGTVVGVAVTPLLQTWLCPYGLRYVMLAMGLAGVLQVITVVVLTFKLERTRLTFGEWRIREALCWQDVKSYLRIAAPSAVFVAAEAGAFDATILITATLGDAVGSAWSAISNTEFLMVSLANGFSVAACAKVGSALGANQPINARTYAFAAIGAVVMSALLINTPLVALYFDNMMRFFGAGNEEEVVLVGGEESVTETIATTVTSMITATLKPSSGKGGGGGGGKGGHHHSLANDPQPYGTVKFIFIINQILDTIEVTCQGIFSGANMNHLGAPLLVASMWGVGVTSVSVLGLGVIPKAIKHIFGAAAVVVGGSSSSHHHGGNAIVTYLHDTVLPHAYQFFHSIEGLIGVALGTCLGLMVLAPLLVITLYRLDWDSLALQGQIEAGEEDDDDEEDEEEDEMGADEGADAAALAEDARRIVAAVTHH